MKTLLNVFDRLMIAATFAEAGLDSPLAATNTNPSRRAKRGISSLGGAVQAAGARN